MILRFAKKRFANLIQKQATPFEKPASILIKRFFKIKMLEIWNEKYISRPFEESFDVMHKIVRRFHRRLNPAANKWGGKLIALAAFSGIYQAGKATFLRKFLTRPGLQEYDFAVE